MSTDPPLANDLFPWEQDDDEAVPAGAEADPPATRSPEVVAPAEAAAMREAAVVRDDHGTHVLEPGLFGDDAEDDSFVESGSGVAPQASSRPIAAKEYYSISEVCDLVGLKPHVLRYWETQFQVLNPSKNRSGNRVYQRKEIRLILLVKQLLYVEKYTVEGARAKLDVMRRGGQLAEATGRVLEPQFVELLRQDLDRLKKILTLPSNG